MKAVILLGGSGSRLRPISDTIPKALLPLVDRPLLRHTIEQLVRQEIRELCLVCGRHEEEIREAVGDGSRYGAALSFLPEQTPLGTAGAAALCSSGNEDLLVVSGDGAWDLDLGAAIAFHKTRQAEATILRAGSRDPRGYGMVVTTEDGRVLRFLEKPGWDSVYTDRVNTGIYLLSPALLREIPRDVACDFAEDLFPRWLAAGRRIYAVDVPGYWCDIGTPERYREAVRAALSGRLRTGLPRGKHGVHTASPIPQDAVVTPPVYIGEQVCLGEGVRIGPYTVLQDGCRVGSGAEIVGSVVMHGAQAASGARVMGSVLCPDAVIEADAGLGEGCVIGAGARVGSGARLEEGLHIPANHRCPAGRQLRYAGTHTEWDPEELLSTGEALTPELLTAVGTAAVMLSGENARIGIGHGKSPVCGMLASALSCGVRACGGRAVMTGADCAAQAAYAAVYGGFSWSFFLADTPGGAVLKIYDEDGLTPRQANMARLQFLLRQGVLRHAAHGMTGGLFRLRGLRESHARKAVAGRTAAGWQVTVEDCTAAPALCNALWLMGVRIVPRGSGRAIFSLTEDGFGLRITTESGRQLPPERCFLLAAWLRLKERGEIALPFDRAAVLDAYPGRILRLGRDGEAARALWAKNWVLRDGVAQAAAFAAVCAGEGITLDALDEAAPQAVRLCRELPLRSSRAGLMQAAGARFGGAEYGQGLRFSAGGGTAALCPVSGRSALRLTVECGSMEAAEELAGGLAEQISALDHDVKRRKNREETPDNWRNL